MENTTARFATLLEQTLIPAFCSKSSRNLSPLGFRGGFAQLPETDIADFLRGWEAELLTHIDNGLYRATHSGASEQFFWSGKKANTPRTFTLWIEPIITLGVLARMHLDFGWPKSLIASQSKRDWAFDAFALESEPRNDLKNDDPRLLIACEVKKTRKEIDSLIDDMQWFGRYPSPTTTGLNSAKKNAFRKVKALRACRPSIFWAVGPGRYEKVFSVAYLGNDVVEFQPNSPQALGYGA
jgi:hypothetical protein